LLGQTSEMAREMITTLKISQDKESQLESNSQLITTTWQQELVRSAQVWTMEK
jgi:hypothetical protein